MSAQFTRAAADLPTLVEPHPLAGVFADPAFDDIVQKLDGRLDVDVARQLRGSSSRSSTSSRKRFPGSRMQRAG